MTDNTAELPQWSDWHVRELGRADTPQFIQCRHCLKLKHVSTTNYRNIRTTDRWRTTCRSCENKKPYTRSYDGQRSLIRADPRIPPALKEELRVGLADRVKVEGAAAKSRAAQSAAMVAFVAQWDAVRQVVSYRRMLLAHAAMASKSPHGLRAKITGRAPVALYIAYYNAVLDLYSTITKRLTRLRDPQRWYATVDGHLPPKHWADAANAFMQAKYSLTFAQAEQASGRITARQSATVWSVSPWELTTRAERDAVRRHNPLALEDDYADQRQEWRDMMGQRARGSLLKHLHPDCDATGIDLCAITPGWLRKFNGYPRP